MYYFTFLPLVDPFWLWLLTIPAILLVFASFAARGQNAFGRACVVAALLLALWNPNLAEEEHTPIDSIALVLIDRTASQKLGTRENMTDTVKADLQQKLTDLDASEVRYIDVPDSANNTGTRLVSALTDAMADIPSQRLSGVIIITDGVVHDIPDNVAALSITVPVHVLITGYEDERDRQIRLISAPRFGIVGKKQSIIAEIQERNGTGSARVTIRVDGKEIEQRTVATGRSFSIDVDITHAGMNVVELQVAPLEQELTLVNNHAVLTIEGIREKLRVLLVSGAPHSGGLTWRNLLKSDTNIDLVHFNILRNITKFERAPAHELALIVFPTQELFEDKINQFDLIILDRYDNYGVLPFEYFNNITRFVERGGAILIAAGPEFADEGSLALTPLKPVIPAFPDGQIYEQPYKPQLTDKGKRHPVTRDLSGSETSPPSWGEWLRHIGTKTTEGTALLSGVQDTPLLLLNHFGKGRSALILSDHPWLWARQYRGGGPHADLLRHISHWLMKEPALEEEALRATANNQTITIERQTMADQAQDVILKSPDGKETRIALAYAKPGLFSASFTATQNGMHTLTSDPDLTAFVNIGPGNPKELENIFSTTDLLRPFVERTGGSIRRVGLSQDKPFKIPDIKIVKPRVRAYGQNWIGLRETKGSIVQGVRVFPLGLGFAALFFLAGLLLMTWLSESRNKNNG